MASSRVIGLDIATTGVRAAQVEFGSGGPRGKAQPSLVKIGHVPLPIGAVRDGEVVDPSTVSSALKQLWAQSKFDSKDVVIGIGGSRVVVRDLDLPWMPLAQLKAALPYQVQEFLPMSTDEAMLDFYPTREYEADNGRIAHGLLVAAPRDTVNASVLAVMGAGLKPKMVDLNAFALLRGLARGDLANRTVAFVDIGARITNVVIAEQGVPRMVRMLRQGGQDVTDAVASAMQITSPEADLLKREIGVGYGVPPDRQAAADAITETTHTLLEAVRNTFTFYAGNHPGSALEVIVLTGGGSHLPGLGQYLSSASRTPVSLGDPISTLKTGKAAGHEAFAGYESLLAIAVGLAYGEAA